jgi:hypothetical protein
MKIGQSLGQGDVYLERISATEIDPATEVLERDSDGSLTLAHGEVTGHRHRFHRGERVRYFRNEKLERRLLIEQGAVLRHEEHGPVHVPAGAYRVIQPMEYTPEAPRQVED